MDVHVGIVKKKPNGWENKQKVLELMLRQFNYQASPTTLHLLGRRKRNPSLSSHSSWQELGEFDLNELDKSQSLPPGWDKFLNLKTGAVYYINSEAGIKVRSADSLEDFPVDNSATISSGGNEALDLKMNLSTTTVLPKMNAVDNENVQEKSHSFMRLVGCSKCLMYSMVSSQNLKCPVCKGSFLLQFGGGDFSSNSPSTAK